MQQKIIIPQKQLSLIMTDTYSNFADQSRWASGYLFTRAGAPDEDR